MKFTHPPKHVCPDRETTLHLLCAIARVETPSSLPTLALVLQSICQSSEASSRRTDAAEDREGGCASALKPAPPICPGNFSGCWSLDAWSFSPSSPPAFHLTSGGARLT